MSYAERNRQGKLTGRWIGERSIDGVRRRVRCDKKSDADKWEAIVSATGKAPIDGTGASVAHSLGAVAKEARAQRKGWKGSRDPSLDQRLEDVLTFLGPTNSVETVTTDKLTELVKHLEARKGRDGGKLSPKTINRYLAVVSAILDYARFRGWSKHAPDFPWQEEPEGRIEYLRDGQDEAIDALMPSRAYQICREVLTKSGLRPSEFFSLDASRIDIRNDWCWLRMWSGETKNDAARSIPIRIELGRELLALVVSGELPSHDEFYRAFKDACSRLNYSSDLTVYSLRHTALTRAARKNSGAKVQNFAGHKDYKTTQKYIHLSDEDNADVAESMVA